MLANAVFSLLDKDVFDILRTVYGFNNFKCSGDSADINVKHIIPVLDILNGVVVRAVQGQREQYRPINRLLAASADPSVVLQSLLDVCPAEQVYIADIDALQGRPMDRCALAELSRFDVDLIVDRGVRCVADIEEVFELGGSRAVIALETAECPDSAASWREEFSDHNLIAGIDLKNGKCLVDQTSGWAESPLQVGQQFVEMGYRDFLTLDLASVGSHSGPTTAGLCQQLRQLPEVRTIITGGGIRSQQDVDMLLNHGVDSVLVSTALHDGSLTKSE